MRAPIAYDMSNSDDKIETSLMPRVLPLLRETMAYKSADVSHHFKGRNKLEDQDVK